MAGLLTDIRVGIRTLARTPGFALTAILTLALGIGLATAVFTVADALLLRRLPVRDQDRLVVLWGQKPGREFAYPLALEDSRDFARRARSLRGVAFNLSRRVRPARAGRTRRRRASRADHLPRPRRGLAVAA